MCGIAGIVRPDGRPIDKGELRDMCRVMVHRGPDDEGVHIGEGIGLAMRRLSIIDLARRASACDERRSARLGGLQR